MEYFWQYFAPLQLCAISLKVHFRESEDFQIQAGQSDTLRWKSVYVRWHKDI